MKENDPSRPRSKSIKKEKKDKKDKTSIYESNKALNTTKAETSDHDYLSFSDDESEQHIKDTSKKRETHGQKVQQIKQSIKQQSESEDTDSDSSVDSALYELEGKLSVKADSDS